MRAQLKGGKTAPRILQDLNSYDPRRLPPTGYNILTELPIPFEDNKIPPARVAKGSCHHGWILKDEQCFLPDSWDRRQLTSNYVVAAYCTFCRSHLELSIDLRAEGQDSKPCPNETWPLHHFVHVPGLSTQAQIAPNGTYAKPGSNWIDSQQFQCSSPQCSAQLSIRIKPCRLLPEWVDLLTSTEIIKIRAEKAISEEPGRYEGIAIPTPTEVLSNLRTYIVNAMAISEGRTILGNNKKWRLCLGEPCTALLEYLGFTREDLDWKPPRPEPGAKTPFTNPLNVLLNDVEKELVVLLSKRPDQERVGRVVHISASATPELRGALGCLEYPTVSSSRTVDLTFEEHPFYASLGATVDFHDELIIFAYKRQIDVDQKNTPYYLECLQGLGEGRKSEDLQTHAAIEASSDKISLKDVRNAYKDLGLDFNFDLLDDETVIGTFQSRVSDAPRQESELRRALQIIGRNRGSEKIQFIASKVITNYEQALLWLGATEDMDEGFLVSMYSVKVGEKPSDESIARQAMSLIAEHRDSTALKRWIDTGILGESEMDVGYAYNRLGISDRTIDDETILAAYNYLATDTPSQIDDLKRALAAIAKSKESRLLQGFLNTGKINIDHPLSEWPVGLKNIGNTCYLNSLLQFYFTVAPLRDLVLDFEHYKMSIGAESLAGKRVGSRNVSLKEVLRAQRFVYELQKLFKNMITAPKDQVTPEQELARLTLISSTNEESFRRKSVLSAHRPSLGEINGQPVIGPELPPQSLPKQHDIETDRITTRESANIDKAIEENTFNNADTVMETIEQDSSSENTLVDVSDPRDTDAVMTDNDNDKVQQRLLEDKENLPPTKSLVERVSTPEKLLTPLGDTSPSRTNEQPRPLSPIKELYQDQGETEIRNATSPPSRPPPFPPRPKSEDQKVLQEEISYGAQQDVTEVIANVLFQLQCAIRPDSVDESGEQIDRIKELFFGKQKSYTTDVKGSTRTKEEFMSDIKVDVESGPRDIYAALDGAYDVQEVEVGGGYEPQYTTISQLPPILQVLVQRVQFDPRTKTPYKSNHHLKLKETIYMDRYMDSDDPDLKQRRHECWDWKKRLNELENRKSRLAMSHWKATVPEILAYSTGYLEQLASVDVATASMESDAIKVSPTLIQDITTASNEAKEEVKSIDQHIKTLTTSINSQFNDLRNIPYRLQSVFIHRGFVQSGHYWIYIRDFETDIWRKYNDEYVEEVKDTNEIFQQELTDRPATSYFVVYVKDELKDRLVNPVCRETVEEPEIQDTYIKTNTNETLLETEDIAMEDADIDRPASRVSTIDAIKERPVKPVERMQGPTDERHHSYNDLKINRASTDHTGSRNAWDHYSSVRGDSW